MEAATFAANAPIELRYVGPEALERLRAIEDPVVRAQASPTRAGSTRCRRSWRPARGTSGRRSRCMDLLAWLHLEVLEGDDVCFSSKGHDAPAVYAVLAGTRQARLRPAAPAAPARRAARPPGHRRRAGVPTNTGSLGMGVSKAKGFARAARLQGAARRVFVITRRRRAAGGPVLGVARPGRQRGLRRDHRDRRPQQDPVRHLGRPRSPTSATSRPRCARSAGRSRAATATTSTRVSRRRWAALLERRPPEAADRRHGQGPRRRRLRAARPRARRGTALYTFHSGAPAPELYAEALAEIAGRLGRRGRSTRGPRSPRRVAPATPQKLVAAYGEALAAAAGREPRLVALDADLYLDCGLIPFRERFPERFVECGIAEQDMVSPGRRAGARRDAARRPLVRLLPDAARQRAGLQQRHRAHEGASTRGFLAGIVPGGPGHSHQSVRDIALMGSVPGMAVPGARHRGRGAPLRRVGGASTRTAPSTCGSSRCRGSSASSAPDDRPAACPAAAPWCAPTATSCSSAPARCSPPRRMRPESAALGPAPLAARRRRRMAGGRRRRPPDRRARQPLDPRRPGRRGARRAAGHARRDHRHRPRARVRHQRGGPARARARRRLARAAGAC